MDTAGNIRALWVLIKSALNFSVSGFFLLSFSDERLWFEYARAKRDENWEFDRRDRHTKNGQEHFIFYKKYRVSSGEMRDVSGMFCVLQNFFDIIWFYWKLIWLIRYEKQRRKERRCNLDFWLELFSPFSTQQTAVVYSGRHKNFFFIFIFPSPHCMLIEMGLGDSNAPAFVGQTLLCKLSPIVFDFHRLNQHLHRRFRNINIRQLSSRRRELQY